MTLTATWIADEGRAPRLWMATDSRISDNGGVLLEEGVKLFELPIVMRGPGASGFFDQVNFQTTIGLACTGSTLVFQQVYATLVPLASNLGGFGDRPTLFDLASFIGRLATTYIRSFGTTRPNNSTVGIVVAGSDPMSGELLAYDLSASLDSMSMYEFLPNPVDLANSRVHFTGDPSAILEAERLLDSFRKSPMPGISCDRAPLNVVRQVISSEVVRSVGGDVQIGFTVGERFRRATTMTPVTPGMPEIQAKLNNVPLAEIGQIGPCFTALQGMVSP
jgi:hypothetical protein